MAYVNCNLCGANDFTIVFPKGFAQVHQIVRCSRCSLMYANPQERIDVETFLNPDRFIDENNPSTRQYIQKQHVQLPDNLRALKVLDQLQPKRGKLLEIGSYLGIFLDKIRADGWDTTGLEPDPWAAKYARAKYNHNLIEATLPDAKLPDAAFDAVMMLHVIEHMPSPAQNLQEIRRILKRDGVLVVETPRFDSLMFKIMGRRERSLSNCNGHIYFFTVPTLTQLLEKNGFVVERVELVGRTLTAGRFLYNIGVMSRSDAVRKCLQQFSQFARLDQLHFHANARDMQRIFCRAK